MNVSPSTDSIESGPKKRFSVLIAHRRLLLIVAAVVATAVWDVDQIYSTLHQPTRVVGTVKTSDGKPVAEAWVCFDAHSIRGAQSRSVDLTEGEGVFSVEHQRPEGTPLVLYAYKRGYEPQLQAMIADRQKHEVNFVLKPEAKWKRESFKVSDRVEVWEEYDWCDAVVVTVGAHNTPTPDGLRELTGAYLVEMYIPPWVQPRKLWKEETEI
jgi:hypothetical protein